MHTSHAATLRLASNPLEQKHLCKMQATKPSGHGTHLRVLYEGGEVDDGPVQDSKQQDGQAGEDHVVSCCTDAVHQGLPTEAIVELVEEQDKGEADVLVEGVLDEAGEAVAGEAAVHQQQAHQETELPNGIV